MKKERAERTSEPVKKEENARAEGGGRRWEENGGKWTA